MFLTKSSKAAYPTTGIIPYFAKKYEYFPQKYQKFFKGKGKKVFPLRRGRSGFYLYTLAICQIQKRRTVLLVNNIAGKSIFEDEKSKMGLAFVLFVLYNMIQIRQTEKNGQRQQ